MKRIYFAGYAAVCAVVAAAALFATPGAAQAQGWKPDKHVELIVPTGAGGSLDATGRTIQRIWEAEKLLGGCDEFGGQQAGRRARGRLQLT